MRALMIYDQVPADCILHTMRNAMHEPHVHVGEGAVVDTTDTRLQHGELYLIQWQSGRRDVMQANYRTLCGSEMAWWLSPLNRPKGHADAMERARQGRILFASDGPYEEEHLQSKVVGRIIGVFQD